jgi:hypothetical protein
VSVIITHLIGGLGNQMFQYAAGRALSIRHKAQLLLDIGDFSEYRLHQGFELASVFSCPVTLAEPQDVRSVLGWQSSRLVRKIFARPALRSIRNRHFTLEPHFHYWSGIRDVLPPCYLMGYWQSERYFADVAPTIRKDFTFREPLSGRNLELAAEITSVNAVSLHVRRGDYVSDPKTTATHRVCSLEYYHSAIKYIADHVERPHFFVFSDDMDWVKSNLKSQFPLSYVDHNQGADSYNDMRLMSLCHHHIISNSSFSWWGAWLDDRPDKIVIAPKRWFANYEADTRDLYCPGWVLL